MIHELQHILGLCHDSYLHLDILDIFTNIPIHDVFELVKIVSRQKLKSVFSKGDE